MWIVALALRRPYTFVVMALVILILSSIVIYHTPTDIFPSLLKPTPISALAGIRIPA